MISKRIKTIASLVNKGDIVVDIGTDHGYLPIYLIKNNIAKKAYACDISKNALDSAIRNIKKENLPIEAILSDGLKEVNISFDNLIITGMGFYTIKSILESDKIPNTIILQSNSDHYKMRKYMLEKGYCIDKEVTLQDKKIFYVIIKYIKGSEKLTKNDLMFGKSNNNEYLNYLLQKKEKISKNIPLIKKMQIKIEIINLKKLLKKNRT